MDFSPLKSLMKRKIILTKSLIEIQYIFLRIKAWGRWLMLLLLIKLLSFFGLQQSKRQRNKIYMKDKSTEIVGLRSNHNQVYSERSHILFGGTYSQENLLRIPA